MSQVSFKAGEEVGEKLKNVDEGVRGDQRMKKVDSGDIKSEAREAISNNVTVSIATSNHNNKLQTNKDSNVKEDLSPPALLNERKYSFKNEHDDSKPREKSTTPSPKKVSVDVFYSEDPSD